MRFLMKGLLCLLLGAVFSVIALIMLMFWGGFEVIQVVLVTGVPLSELFLTVVPDGVWEALTGVSGVVQHSYFRSLLATLAALGQCALLLAAGFYWLWYRA